MNNFTADDIQKLLREYHKPEKWFYLSEVKNGSSYTAPGRLKIMDGWAMAKSWTYPNIRAYEIKVSRNDFLQDKKWQDYLPYCNELYFVAPKGIIEPNELPAEAGLLQVASTGTKLLTKKKAARREVEIPEKLFRYILMWRVQERKDDYDRASLLQEWLDKKQDNYVLGQRIAYHTAQYIRGVESKSEELKDKIRDYKQIEDFLIKNGVNINDNWQRTYHAKPIQELVENELIQDLKRVKSGIDEILEEVNKRKQEQQVKLASQ